MNTELLLCILGCSVATCGTRVLPMMYLVMERVPAVILRWLSFVPVAVMAALLGPDIMVREGHFALHWHNIYLLAAVPALAVSWKTKSFFGTIAVGMGGVAFLRYVGWGA